MMRGHPIVCIPGHECLCNIMDTFLFYIFTAKLWWDGRISSIDDIKILYDIMRTDFSFVFIITRTLETNHWIFPYLVLSGFISNPSIPFSKVGSHEFSSSIAKFTSYLSFLRKKRME